VKGEELLGGVDGGEFDSTFGFALQGGIDYEINNRWFVNFDIKQKFISTDMTIYHGWCGTHQNHKWQYLAPIIMLKM